MKKNLMEYLFGVSQQESEIESILDEDFAALLEQADAEEGEQMAASKTPLVDALKSVGITAGELHEDPAGFCFYTSDREEYISAINALTDPDTMHKLAVKGWVATKCGDQAMSQEEPEYKIRFLEISTAEGSDKDKGEDLEAILKRLDEQSEDIRENRGAIPDRRPAAAKRKAATKHPTRQRARKTA